MNELAKLFLMFCRKVVLNGYFFHRGGKLIVVGEGAKVYPLPTYVAYKDAVGNVVVNEIVLFQPGLADNQLGSHFRAEIKGTRVVDILEGRL